MSIPFLSTPQACFDGLPGFPWPALHLDELAATQGLRLACVDAGPADAPATALCLHGNPSWGYLYRHMIPEFLSAGLRVVVPDLIGFGRSDKPVDEAAHTFDLHRQTLLQLIERLDLNNVMLVCQDWGGIFGLTLPMAMPQRFTRLLVMNTTLADGRLSEGFRQWRSYSNSQGDLAVGKMLRRGKPDMSAEEAAAYDAPFPDASHKAALRAFPDLVPDAERDGADAAPIVLAREAAAFWRERWQGDSFMAVGMQDPVLGPPVMQALRRQIRGCSEAFEVAEGGHFVQEWGGPIARAALKHFRLG